MYYTAGNKGEGVRSDCAVNFEPTSTGGIDLYLESKVGVLYGESIRALCISILEYFEIKNARLEIFDQGALPFVIAARIEAAIKYSINSDREYLLPLLPQNEIISPVDAERITRLYLPGNNPKLMINAGIYKCNGVILDLEDAVAPSKKHEARFLVRNALRSVNFYGAERMVRINQLPEGLKDLHFCIPHGVNLILIPKCESAGQVIITDARISEILGHKNTEIHLMPIIESAAGVLHASEIARASENVVAIAIGLEDYTADIGVQRSTEGNETWFARNMIINAAADAGIQAIDSVNPDIENMDALAKNAVNSRSMGFQGMGCIHPRQIKVIHDSFIPDDAETGKAKRIVRAYEEALKNGSSVVALDSKMIDPPVVKRALRTIKMAMHAGRIPENWRAAND